MVVDNTTDLVTVKTLGSGDSTPDVGDTVTFQIEVTNAGSALATGVFLTDFLPQGLTATNVNGTVSQGSYDAATGIFGIGDLAVGQTATLILEGTVDAGQGGNTITNVTTAATGDQPDPSTAGDDLNESVVVNAPVASGSISGVVFQDNNNDGIQDAGEVGIAGVQIVLTGTDVFGNPVQRTVITDANGCLLYTSPSPRDATLSRMPSSA